jgi:hypothetical protein
MELSRLSFWIDPQTIAPNNGGVPRNTFTAGLSSNAFKVCISRRKHRPENQSQPDTKNYLPSYQSFTGICFIAPFARILTSWQKS